MSEQQTLTVPLNGASFAVVEHDSRQWWLAHEFCKYLGINDVGQAVRQTGLVENEEFILLEGAERSRLAVDHRLVKGLRRVFLLSHLGLLGLLQNSRKAEAKRIRVRLFALFAARGGNEVRLGGDNASVKPQWPGLLKLFEQAQAGDVLAVAYLRGHGFTPDGAIPAALRPDPGPSVVFRLIRLTKHGNRWAGNYLGQGLHLPVPAEMQLTLPAIGI